MSTVSAGMARKFSNALGHLYACTSLRELEEAVQNSVDMLFPVLAEPERIAYIGKLNASGPSIASTDAHQNISLPFLLSLLEPHLIRCRSRIRGESTPITRPPSSPSPEARLLTAREVQVLQRIALGETDAQIGVALYISPKTVSKHVEHILLKLGVETRTAAVIRIHSSIAPL